MGDPIYVVRTATGDKLTHFRDKNKQLNLTLSFQPAYRLCHNCHPESCAELDSVLFRDL